MISRELNDVLSNRDLKDGEQNGGDDYLWVDKLQESRAN